MSITIRCGRAPAFQAFARARARASRSAPSSVGSAAIAAITRKAVASDATGPNSGSRSPPARRAARQSPPSASITARSRTTRPRSCPPRRSRILARPSDNAAVRPSLSAASANSPAPACDTSPSPSDATSTVKRRPSRDTLKVILPSRGFDLRHAEESLLNRTVQRPRPPGPQLPHARSGLESFYFAFGDTDAYVIVDATDTEAATAVALAVNASGGATVKTVVLLTPEEVDAAAQRAVDYRPPGA